MQAQQFFYTDKKWNFGELQDQTYSKSDSLILLFQDRIEYQESTQAHDLLSQKFPDLDIVFISTGGSITDDDQIVDSPYAVLLHLEKSRLVSSIYSFDDYEDETTLGEHIISATCHEELKYIMLFTVGNEHNIGSVLRGLDENLNKKISISGGIAADSTRFDQSLVGLNGTVNNHSIVSIAFYGQDLKVKTNYSGGWIPFGPSRTVTRSEDNVLYEIDGQPALDLYKKYLGEEHTAKLPESALYFPLQVDRDGKSEPIARTVLSIDEESKTMHFAGDIPQDVPVRLMRTTLEEIILAAGNTLHDSPTEEVEVTLLISCIGRRLLLEQRIEEEIEEVRDHVPNDSFIFGYYSYGEISMNSIHKGEIYNQTMTITTFSEK